MVPISTNTWHEDMIDELYSSLLGKKYDNGSDFSENEEKEQKEKDNTIESGLNSLRIFG
jgi:protein AATF/BFR2